MEDLDAFSSDEASFKGGKPDTATALPGFQRRFTVKETVTYESLFTAVDFRKVYATWRDRLLQVLDQSTSPAKYRLLIVGSFFDIRALCNSSNPIPTSVFEMQSCF